jgi:hypothetical protein
MCAMLVRHKIDADAGDVIAAMLQLSRPHETRLQEDRSAPLAEAAITAVVAKAATKGACRIQPQQVPGARARVLLAAAGARGSPYVRSACLWPFCRRNAAPLGGRHI